MLGCTFEKLKILSKSPSFAAAAVIVLLKDSSVIITLPMMCTIPVAVLISGSTMGAFPILMLLAHASEGLAAPNDSPVKDPCRKSKNIRHIRLEQVCC